MHIFRYFEIAVTVKKRFLCKLAFSVFVVAAVIPVGITAVSICADVVGYIRNYKLRLGDIVLLEVLKIVVVNLALCHSQYAPLNTFSEPLPVNHRYPLGSSLLTATPCFSMLQRVSTSSATAYRLSHTGKYGLYP